MFANGTAVERNMILRLIHMLNKEGFFCSSTEEKDNYASQSPPPTTYISLSLECLLIVSLCIKPLIPQLE